MTLVPPVTFQLDRSRPIELPLDAGDEALWNALCHRILRSPRALGEHARRLSLCRRAPMQRFAAGALADLLHELEGGGQALAQRQLSSVSRLIDERDRPILSRWATTGCPPHDAQELARLRALPGRRLPAFRPSPVPTDIPSTADVTS